MAEQKIQLPNGDNLLFPADMADDQIQAEIEKEYPQYAQAPAAQSIADRAQELPPSDAAQLAGVGFSPEGGLDTATTRAQNVVVDRAYARLQAPVAPPQEALPAPGLARAEEQSRRNAQERLAQQGQDFITQQNLVTRLDSDTPYPAEQDSATTLENLARVQPRQGVESSGIARYARDFSAGELGSTGSFFDYLGVKTGSAELSAIGKSMGDYAQKITPRGQQFADKLASGLGSFATFYIPGLGVQKGVQLLSAVPRVAQFGGATAMAGLESAMEAGGVYETAIKQGKTHEQALAAADKAFLLNAPVILVSDKIAFFNNFVGPLKQGLVAAGVNAGQEAYQQGVSNTLTDRPLTEGMGESALIGGIIGGGAGAVQGLAEQPNEPTLRQQLAQVLHNPTEQQLALDRKVNAMTGGKPDETISARVAKAQDTSATARIIGKGLEALDPGHLQASLEAENKQAPSERADLTPVPGEESAAILERLDAAGTGRAPIKVETAQDVAVAAQRVAPAPTEAQKEAGNYAKGHVQWNGLPISIENAAGSTRSGLDSDGEAWSTTMPADYGYIKRTNGADGDQIDVYMGPDVQSQEVYIVDQIDPETGKFDEHKSMLGFASDAEAISAYQRGFSDGSGASRMGAVTRVSVEDFKAWIADGRTTKPVAYAPPKATGGQDAGQTGTGVPEVPPGSAPEQAADTERGDILGLPDTGQGRGPGVVQGAYPLEAVPQVADRPQEASVSLKAPVSRQAAVRKAAVAAGGVPTLTGLPQNPIKLGTGWYVPGPSKVVHGVAKRYMQSAKLPYNPPTDYVKVNPATSAKIADAYATMKHAPNDPTVKAAYAKMIEEAVAQYHEIEKTGLKVNFIDPAQGDPYAGNPRGFIADIMDNNHLWVFSTKDGFGTSTDFNPAQNPLLAETDIEIDGQRALANDVFRIVHDYFGHAMNGVGFRADGEENAWREHAAMFSPLARRAVTTETRGQNSWLNYGPYGETNRTAKAADTHFADQKTGLLPEWVSEINAPQEGEINAQAIRSNAGQVRQGSPEGQLSVQRGPEQSGGNLQQPASRPPVEQQVQKAQPAPVVQSVKPAAGLASLKAPLEVLIRRVTPARSTLGRKLDLRPAITRVRALMDGTRKPSAADTSWLNRHAKQYDEAEPLAAAALREISATIKTLIPKEGAPLPEPGTVKETEAAYATSQTQTPAFQKWFGNSKVVDAEGKPMVVYHATGAKENFEKFRRRVGDIGIHFGTVGQAEDRIAYQAERRDLAALENSRLIPVYLRITNPLRLNDPGMWNVDNLGYQLKKLFPRDAEPSGDPINRYKQPDGSMGYRPSVIDRLKSTKDIREYIQSKGYDGVVYQNTGEISGAAAKRAELDQLKAKAGVGRLDLGPSSGKDAEYDAWLSAREEFSDWLARNQEDSYIAFEPTQIKSAIGNKGTFSLKKPSIIEEPDPLTDDIKIEQATPEVNTLAVRPNPTEKDAYQVTAEMVTVGKRKLPAKISTVEDAVQAFAYLPSYAVEHYDAIVTDAKGKPLAVIGSFKGALTQTSVFPATVLQELALIEGATTVWAAHNHPSGRAEFSESDKALSSNFADLIGGMNLDYRGLFALAKDGDRIQFALIDRNGGFTENNPRGITPSRATKNVGVQERMMGGDPSSLSITSPAVARDVVSSVAKGNAGLVLLSAQHNPVAFLPMTPEQMFPLRKGDGFLNLVKRIAKTNAGAAFIANPNDSLSENQMQNVAAALKNLDIRTLDVLSYNYTEADGAKDIRSGAERGTWGEPQKFFLSSDTSGEAEFARQRLHQTLPYDVMAYLQKNHPTWVSAVESLRTKGEKGERGGLVLGTSEDNMARATTLLAKKRGVSEDRVRAEVKANVRSSLSPIAVQVAKQEVKAIIREELDAGRITPEHAFRGTTAEELRHIATTGELLVGQNFEGQEGISAAVIGDGQFPVYGRGAGIIVPPEFTTDSGYASEVLVDPKTDPKKLEYILDGRVLSFAQMKKATTGADISKVPQTETPAFKSWFGDSKIVNDLGKPRVMYHGTGADFEVFEGREVTRWFSTTRFLSEVYANEYARMDEGPHLMPVYLSVQNPLRLEFDMNAQADATPELKATLNRLGLPERWAKDAWLNWEVVNDNRFMAAVEEAGYDGVEVTERGVLTVAILRSTQVKSAIGNIGEFSPRDPSIVRSAADRTNGFYSSELGISFINTDHLSAEEVPGVLLHEILHQTATDDATKALGQEVLRRIGIAEKLFPKEAVQKSTSPVFFSALETAIPEMRKAGAKDGTINTQQAKRWIAARAAEGKFKKAEVEAVGLNDWLDLQPAKTSISEIEAFVKQNGVQVEEVTLEAKSVKLVWEKDDQGDYEDNEVGYKLRHNKVGKYWEVMDERGDLIAYHPELAQAKQQAEHHLDEQNSSVSTGAPKFASYQLPGGENYKELLLTLPEAPASERTRQLRGRMEYRQDEDGKWNVWDRNDWVYKEGFATREEVEAVALADDQLTSVPEDKSNFKSAHFDQPNILAHVRFNERTDADGKRVLFLEELQSDWGQKGKKEGFAGAETDALNAARVEYGELVRRQINNPRSITTEDKARIEELKPVVSGKGLVPTGIPSAPFVTDTKAWTALALKRMIRYAADNGFDKIAWTTGEQQAARYDLSKQVDSVSAEKIGEDEYRLTVTQKGRSPHWAGDMKSSALEDHIGKELANKIISDGGGTYSGIDLKVGGEGMKGYYDQIVPQVANDVLKKLGGGKVESVGISTSPSFDKTARDLLVRINKTSDGRYRAGVGAGDERIAKTFDTDAEAQSWAREQVRLAQERPVSVQNGFTLTPEMKSRAQAGQPLFSRPGKTSSADIYERVQQRMERAGETGNADEAANYLVEEAMNMATEAGHSAINEKFWAWARKILPRTAIRTLKRWLANLRAMLYKRGIIVKVEDLSVEDMAAVAVRNMQELATGKREAAGQEVIVNIGLDIPGGGQNTADAVRSALKDVGVEILSDELRQSNTEPTLIATLSRPLTPEEAYKLSETLKQEAIAQRVDGRGELYGPKADDWKPFNPEYFLTPETVVSAKSTKGLKEGEVPPIKATHFSSQQRPVLSGRMYGTGLRGAERMRLAETNDQRIRTRLSFYVDEGKGVFPESGVGHARHDVVLTNLYDAARNPLRLSAKSFNDFESAVLDSGFDGYYVESGFTRQGVAVLLGDAARSVPTTEQGESPAAFKKSVSALKESEGSRLDKLAFEYVDEFGPLQEWQATLKNVARSEDASMAQQRYSGVVSARVEDFHDDMVGPLLEQIHKADLNPEDVELYLYAKHAPSRNAEMEKINPGETGLSGMSDEEASDIIQQAKDTGTYQKLEAIAEKVYEITAATRANLVKGELMTAEERDAWEVKYENYVPLHRDEVQSAQPPLGKGFSIKGPESKRALGSKKRATNILAHTLAQHEASIIRDEKNKVSRAIFNLLSSHPDSSIGKVDSPDVKKVLDKTSGVAVFRTDPFYKNQPHILSLKIDGVEHTVSFNTADIRAQRMAFAFKNMGGRELGDLTQVVGKFTRFLATMSTSANPVFLARNFARDLQTAAVNLYDTPIKNKTKVFANVPAAMRGFYNMSKDRLDSKWAKDAREFRDEGGQVGWLQNYKDIEDRAQHYRDLVATMKPGALAASKRAMRYWWSLVEDANAAVENAVRLSAYVTARDEGNSKTESALIAKNLTVNFNIRGAKSVELNMWYMFAKASINGTARMFRAAKNPKVRKIMGGMVVIGFLLDALARGLAGDDDGDNENDYDQLPEHTKANNWVFWINGRPITVPQAYGLNFFPNMGRKVSQLVFQKGYHVVDAAVDMFAVAGNSYNPIGTGGSMLQTAMPTIADPFIQLAENRNFAGQPLYKTDVGFGPSKPEYQLGFKSASAMSQAITEWLNNNSGGNAERPGKINLNPSVLDFAVQSVFGGAGKTYTQAVSLPMKLAAGKDIEAREVPFANIFLSAKPQQQAQRKYYDGLEKIQLIAKEAKDPAVATPEWKKAHAAEIGMVGFAKLTAARVNKINGWLKDLAGLKGKASAINNLEHKIRDKFPQHVAELDKRIARDGREAAVLAVEEKILSEEKIKVMQNFNRQFSLRVVE